MVRLIVGAWLGSVLHRYFRSEADSVSIVAVLVEVMLAALAQVVDLSWV